jgi:hypothetical protein
MNGILSKLGSLVMVMLLVGSVFGGAVGTVAADHNSGELVTIDSGTDWENNSLGGASVTTDADGNLVLNSSTSSYDTAGIDVSDVDEVNVTVNVSSLGSNEVPVKITDDPTAVSPNTLTSEYANSTGETTITVNTSDVSTIGVSLNNEGPITGEDIVSSLSVVDTNPAQHTSYRVYAQDNDSRITDFSADLVDSSGSVVATVDSSNDKADFAHDLVEGQNYTFEVQYTDSDGNTVTTTSDEFTAKDQADSISVDGSTYEIYTETDSDGNEYVVYTVSASGEDSHGAETSATEKGSLNVSVDDVDENAIENATVTVTKDSTQYYSGETDANGSYSVENVTTGEYTVQVSHADYDDKTQNVSISDDTETQVDFTLSQSTSDSSEGSVHIRAENESGDGIEGATIELVTDTGEVAHTAQTDADGFAAVNGVVEGNYTVQFDHADHSFEDQNISVSGGETTEVYFGDASEDSTQSTEESDEDTLGGGNVSTDGLTSIIVLVGALISIIMGLVLVMRE